MIPTLQLLLAALTSLNVLVSQYSVQLLKSQSVTPNRNAGVTFSALPIELQIVSLCESQGKPEAISKTRDIGIMQINEKAHLENARAMNLDIFDAEDNMAYGLYLYEKNGLTDWSATEYCWGKALTPSQDKIKGRQNS